MKNFLPDDSADSKREILPASIDLIKLLVKEHEIAIDALQKAIADRTKKYNDTDTINFLMGLIKDHEMITYTLRKVF